MYNQSADQLLSKLNELNIFPFAGHLYGVPRPEEEVRQNPHNYLYSSNCSQSPTGSTTSTAAMVAVDSRGPLPPNWEVAYSENGEKYFIE
jgi:hypothetical protein